MRVVGGVLGGAVVVAVWLNVAITLVIPRGRVGFMKWVDRFVEYCYTALCRLLSTYERRDALRSSQPVAVLGLMLIVWLAAFVVGFGLIEWALGGTFGAALRESGSSLFTLGFAFRSAASPTVVDFFAAASGLTIVALQIAYLPTLYSAFNRRETAVTLLSPRAGIPAWGPEILARAAFTGAYDHLDDLFASWEAWSADVAESHSSYPALLRFRSPQSHSSWIVAQLAVLDAAALQLAASPGRPQFRARLCLQMGFTCLRTLTRTLRIPIDEDPRPDDPVALSWEDFMEGWTRLTTTGYPVERGPEEAWRHFKGWRVNYESAAYTLAYGLDVVPARWAGPRRGGAAPLEPRRFANRTPDNPEDHPITLAQRDRGGIPLAPPPDL